MNKKIPYGRQNITNDDIEAVKRVLESDFITQGPCISEFEKSISNLTGSNYVSAVSSATAALHLGCLALGVKKGSIVWTSSNSFVASANSALYCGAEIDFIDTDENTFNISIDSLTKKLEKAKKNDCLPNLIIPVHLTGNSCNMEKISSLSNQYNFKILEDASHCIGGMYEGSMIGSCQYSDACVFSFHPVKIITTGEGGAITTNNQSLDSKIKKLRTHGIERDNSKFTYKKSLDWYYEQQDLGFNYRMTDIQASLGCSQIKRIKEIINRRTKIADQYNKKLKNKFIKKPNLDFFKGSAFHLYVIRIEEHRDSLREHLLSKNIATNLHYFPIHLQPFYQNMGFSKGMFPTTEKYSEEALSLPIFPELKDEEINYIAHEIDNFFKNVSK